MQQSHLVKRCLTCYSGCRCQRQIRKVQRALARGWSDAIGVLPLALHHTSASHTHQKSNRALRQQCTSARLTLSPSSALRICTDLSDAKFRDAELWRRKIYLQQLRRGAGRMGAAWAATAVAASRVTASARTCNERTASLSGIPIEDRFLQSGYRRGGPENIVVLTPPHGMMLRCAHAAVTRTLRLCGWLH
jgi:hypothetical protein